MTIIITNFQMPDEIKGSKISLKKVERDDAAAMASISEALFSGTTTERIKQTMSFFADSPEDLKSLTKTLNQCFEKNGFNYFIFRNNEAVGQLYGFPCGGISNKTAISIWGWISDKALRQGCMREAVKMVEDVHFSKNSESLEIFVRFNPCVEAFARSIKFRTQDKGAVRSYCKHREEWLREQKPHVIVHHGENLVASQKEHEGHE